MAKYLDSAGLTAYDKKIKAWFKAGIVDIADDAINALFVTVAEGPADNEIWYTSSDGNVVTPSEYADSAFVDSIKSNTYENGKGIITFDGPVTSIGNAAFYKCSSLTSITIPNSVTSIVKYAFSGCSSLTTPVYNAHCFAYMPTSFKGAYVIPEGIKQIAGAAFYECSSLTSVTIPNSVTSIEESAFCDCSSLTSITIPNSVTSIGSSAFTWCSGLTSIVYEGTTEQWDAISKGEIWNYYIPATYVQCSDGQVTL